MFPAIFPKLSCELVSLRELCEDDILAWFARATDAVAADLAGDPVPASIDFGTPWLERQRSLYRRQAGIRWAIEPIGSSGSIGTVGLTLSSTTESVADLSIVVARPHWGKGLGTSASRLAVRYGLFELGLREIYAEVLQRNHASIRLLEKTGFKMMCVLPPTEAEPEVMIRYSLSGPVQGAA